MTRTLIAVATLVALAVAPLAAENWPQWRGPRLDGSSAETGVPLSWSGEDNVAWKLPLPARGAATPIVWDERIFLAGSDDPQRDDALWLWAVDRSSGEILWRQSLGGGNELKRKQTMASPSPVTDGETVWALTGTGVLAAFGVDGTPHWSRNLQEDYGRFGLLWGYAASPLLHDGGLYVSVLHGFETDDPSYVLRIDPTSGKTVWRVERPTEAKRESPDAYTTPMVWERSGVTDLVIVGGDVVTGHDLETGAERWRLGGLNPEASEAQRLVATPVVAGDMLLAFGKRGPALAFRATEEGAPKLVWSVDDSTDVPTPVTDGTYLFTVTDRGIAWCHELATGKVVWGPERLASGPYSASPVLAEGRVYATSESGVTTVFRAAPRFEVLAENDLAGYTLASPAISEGQIFLRTDEFLFAIGERGGTNGRSAR